jgi:cysteine desulfurase family protein (TIGR01976 family)
MNPSDAKPTDASIASTTRIREDFPSLERLYAGFPVAYFDGPGGTQVARPVVDAMSDYLLHHNANTHWAFPTSSETDAALAAARRALADFLNASPDEVAFGPNMTTLTFHLSRALGRSLGPGDAIVVTELDHHANIDPWRALERERGVTILQARMIPETGQLDWDDLDRCLNDHRCRLLAIGAASNALGTINDVPRAVAMAREADALTFVDAVHYAPHQLPDVRAWGCDFLACSAYKFYGPHLGVLYGKRERLEALDVPKLEPASNRAPDRLETGTQNHEGIVGAAAAVDYLASLAVAPAESEGLDRRDRLRLVFEALHRRGAALLAQLSEGLGSIVGVRLFGRPGEPSAGPPGNLRLARRFLRPDGRPQAGRRPGRVCPHRLCVLLDPGRDRTRRRIGPRDGRRALIVRGLIRSLAGLVFMQFPLHLHRSSPALILDRLFHDADTRGEPRRDANVCVRPDHVGLDGDGQIRPGRDLHFLPPARLDVHRDGLVPNLHLGRPGLALLDRILQEALGR